MFEKEGPDHYDADLVLKLYDLRREPLMREARAAMMREYWPRSAEEAVAVARPDHPLNTAFRQTTGYWEMVYGMARHGIIQPDFLIENSGEGLSLYARAEPYLAEIRAAFRPWSFQNAEWVATHTAAGRQRMEFFRGMVAQGAGR